MTRTSRPGDIPKLLLTSLIVLLIGRPASAQKQFNVFESAWWPYNTVHTYLEQQVYRQFEERRSDLQKALSSPAAMRAYRDNCRKRYRQLLGELPARTPLNPRVVGTIPRTGYRIEKVLYESLPGHHVTANVYVPQGKGPFPGVLLFCGHSLNGKEDVSYQKTAILFATHGFVVLVADPISQGERYQLTDAKGRPIVPLGTVEHTLFNAGATLLGTGAVAYELWDNVRGLDYLTGRKDVDTARIGCLGTSGGGTQTTYFVGFDPRIKVSAPCSYVATRERNLDLPLIGASDGCQHIPGEGEQKLEIDDFLIMAAPKPLLVLAARFDFVDEVGVEIASRELQQVYARLGHADRYKLFIYDDGHSIAKPKREAAVTWFRKWLCNDSTPVKEGNIEILPDTALFCTSTGVVNTAFPHERTLKDIDLQLADRYKASRDAFANRTDQREIIRQVLGAPQLSSGISVEWTDSATSGPVVFKKVLVRKKDEIPLPCLVAYPSGPVKNVLVWTGMPGKGRIATDSLAVIREALEHGSLVVLADLRATGETTDAPTNDSKFYYNKEYRNSMTALHVGRSLVGQQVADMITLVDFVDKPGGLGLTGKPIIVRASGGDAVVALHSLALDQRISEVDLYHTIRSWYDLLEDPIQKDQYRYVIPGVLKQYDLPDLVKLAGPDKVFYR